jgi:Uncharacterized protein conserved in bacteria (DUF2188)
MVEPSESRAAVHEDSVHVLVGQQSWVVTRLRPQFNARHTTFEDATAQARQIAARDHGTLLVHDACGDIVTRESYRES